MTETTKWSDPWFRKLTPAQKCLWLYLVDNCDCAGVIDLDLELAGFHIGCTLKQRDIEALAKGIETIPNGKLWLHAFVRFQCGKLSDHCKPHLAVISALNLHGIDVARCYEHKQYPSDTLSLSLAKGGRTLEEQEQDKEKEKDNKGVQGEIAEAIYRAYPRKIARADALHAIHKAIAAGAKPEHLLDRARAYAAATALWPQDEKRFIPYPATWFNRGSYDDDPTQWNGKGGEKKDGWKPEEGEY